MHDYFVFFEVSVEAHAPSTINLYVCAFVEGRTEPTIIHVKVAMSARRDIPGEPPLLAKETQSNLSLRIKEPC